jgi:hypothetical protein
VSSRKAPHTMFELYFTCDSVHYWCSQGENNMVQHYQAANSSWQFQDYYGCPFKAKVNSWRQLFRSPLMLYGFVSLAAYGSDDSEPSERTADGLPCIRLDQNSIMSLQNTGVALALDLGDNGKIPWTPASGLRTTRWNPPKEQDRGREAACFFVRKRHLHSGVRKDLGPESW